jgi:16S rRNA (guanine(1405)-N(7))-methyltransferase
MSGQRPRAAPVEVVTARLAAAAKYRTIHPDTIELVVRREARNTAHPAELERRSRARLHKVAALHLLTIRPTVLRRQTEQAEFGDPAVLRAWCRQMLAAHASSAERLADLDGFYPALFELIPPPREVADVACALNPFSLPWLRDVTGARYVGYDFNETFVDIGNEFFTRCYPDCRVVREDVLSKDEPVTADLVLLLKTYHCIEDRHPGAALRLVDDMAAGHVAISFPTRALNGRAAVFARRHVKDLEDLSTRRGWRLSRIEFKSENVLLISKA